MGYGDGGYGLLGYGVSGTVLLQTQAATIPVRLLPETVTWQRPAVKTDRYGNAADDWTVPITSTLRVRIEQTGAADRTGQTGAAAFGQWRLYTNELTVEGKHRIVRGSAIFEVDGPPDVVYGATGPHHVEARLVAVQT